jgi:REP element-mobilizing transposase RayT
LALTEPPRRRSIRLKNYDYTTGGAYFVTICAHHRESLFGEVKDGVMRLNDHGVIARTAWEDLPNDYDGVRLDAFVVMPNHVHGIVWLQDTVGAGFKPAPTPRPNRHGLPEFVRAFKTFSSRRINERRRTTGRPVWQRGYYEHVVRNMESLQRIEEYILSNPSRWALDPENPQRMVPPGRQGSPE